MSHKILVVDDEPALLRLMEYVLSRAGYTMLTATNGEEALHETRRERPDLIVLDIMMPRMDGYQVAEAIRSDPDPDLRRTPIIMLSAKAQEEDIERGIEAGVDHYVTKPFTPDALTALVATHLNGSRPRAPRDSDT
jgi:DNA-binding response OmpR family regulator